MVDIKTHSEEEIAWYLKQHPYMLEIRHYFLIDLDVVNEMKGIT